MWLRGQPGRHTLAVLRPTKACRTRTATVRSLLPRRRCFGHDTRALDILGVTLPIVQAPMLGAGGAELAGAVAAVGGMGSIPCAALDAPGVRRAAEEAARHMQAAMVHVAGEGHGHGGDNASRAATPFNLNFFCHPPTETSRACDAAAAAWLRRLGGYYDELEVAPGDAGGPSRLPFDDAACAVVEELRPRAVSFHFGLPHASLLQRVKAAGSVVMGCATTVAEAVWLEGQGCDVIVAQGAEAGGHRGSFLHTPPFPGHPDADTAAGDDAAWSSAAAADAAARQVGTLALVPQVVDAVSVPVVAAGGIADGRGVAACLVLGASAVQVGTAFLLTPEATGVSPAHRSALLEHAEDATVLTNVFTGRPARGIRNRLASDLGPVSRVARTAVSGADGDADAVPAFPEAAAAVAPLRSKAEAAGDVGFTPLWSGQGAPLAVAQLRRGRGAKAGGRRDSATARALVDAGTLTRRLAEDARACLAGLSGACGGVDSSSS